VPATSTTFTYTLATSAGELPSAPKRYCAFLARRTGAAFPPLLRALFTAYTAARYRDFPSCPLTTPSSTMVLPTAHSLQRFLQHPHTRIHCFAEHRHRAYRRAPALVPLFDLRLAGAGRGSTITHWITYSRLPWTFNADGTLPTTTAVHGLLRVACVSFVATRSLRGGHGRFYSRCQNNSVYLRAVRTACRSSSVMDQIAHGNTMPALHTTQPPGQDCAHALPTPYPMPGQEKPGEMVKTKRLPCLRPTYLSAVTCHLPVPHTFLHLLLHTCPCLLHTPSPLPAALTAPPPHHACPHLCSTFPPATCPHCHLPPISIPGDIPTCLPFPHDSHACWNG